MFILTAGVYLSTPTADYYWDGITFALQIEKVAAGKRDAGLLFHQNHLLYNALGYLVYRATHAIGFSTRALSLLQTANALTGAAAVTVFYRIVHRAIGNLYGSIITGGVLAFSAIWWKLSTDADAYMLSVLFVLLALGHLLSARPRWVIAGLLLASSMLIHELAALFFPAALVAVARFRRRWGFAAGMCVEAWAIAITAYALCARWFHGITQPIEVARWAVSNQSGVAVVLNPVRGLLLMPRGNIDLLVGHYLNLFRQHGTGIERVIPIAAVAAVLACAYGLLHGIRGSPGQSARALRVQGYEGGPLLPLTLVAWVGMYLMFLLFWEPWQTYYRVFYAPALALAVALVFAHFPYLRRTMSCRMAALATTALALSNLAFFIAPNMHRDANVLVAAAQGAGWDEQTVIYFVEHNEADTTFEYFNPSSEWRKLTPQSRDSLESEVALTLNRGGSVWLNNKAAEIVEPHWLARHASGQQITVGGPNVPAVYVQVLSEARPEMNSPE